MNSFWNADDGKVLRLVNPPTQIYIGVSIHLQELYLLEDGTVRRMFSISTSKKEPSCIEDSLGTPWGYIKFRPK